MVKVGTATDFLFKYLIQHSVSVTIKSIIMLRPLLDDTMLLLVAPKTFGNGFSLSTWLRSTTLGRENCSFHLWNPFWCWMYKYPS